MKKKIPKTWKGTPGKLEKWEEWKTCPECNGTGRGNGAFEQGGTVYGLCRECAGHGKWIAVKEGWEYDLGPRREP